MQYYRYYARVDDSKSKQGKERQDYISVKLTDEYDQSDFARDICSKTEDFNEAFGNKAYLRL